MNMNDVARIAGVARATVSRVINAHPSVEPGTARHVREVMKRIGYVPPVNRRGPKPKRHSPKDQNTLSLAILLAGRTRELLEQPSVRRGLAGFTTAAQALHAHTNILEMPDPACLPQSVRDRTVDGLLIIGTQPRAEWVGSLHPIPLVSTGGAVMPETCCDHVLINNAETGRLAARYLLDEGRRDLAYLNHETAHSSFTARLKAFREAVESAGARVRVYEMSERDLSAAEFWTTPRLRNDFTELIERMLADGGMPDGIYLPTDQQAAMLHALLRERGIGTAPTTISCNNDAPWLSAIYPRPATIDLRSEQIGRLALKLLMARIEDPASDFTVAMVSPRLVHGDLPPHPARPES